VDRRPKLETLTRGTVRHPSTTRLRNHVLPSGRAAALFAFDSGLTLSFEETSEIEERASREAVRTPSQVQSSPARGHGGLANWRLIAGVFLPFAAGYYLSYLFRTINTLISGRLTTDLGINAADLGLLASVYFLAFGAAQIPIGSLLDRFGPRRIQSGLLVVAAAGALLFGISTGFYALLIARTMIGFGVAAALMAGLKAVVVWFPRDQVALVNGYMIMFGALGGVSATVPAEWLMNRIGWRGLFELLAAITLATALMIYFAVPEPAETQKADLKSSTLKTVYLNAQFWRVAPLSAVCVGSAWALQGLWAAPWLTDVEGLDRHSLITRLFIMAICICVGALLLGVIADRLRRRGVRTEIVLATLAALFVTAELAVILRVPVPQLLPWCVVSMFGAATVLSYAIMADSFPSEFAARANGGLNLLHFGWAFATQYGIGLILEQWPRQDGHYPVIAYQTAFGLNVAVQVLALAWFIAPLLHARVRALTRALTLRAMEAVSSRLENEGDVVETMTPSAEMIAFDATEDVNW
jgi:MFS family permease